MKIQYSFKSFTFWNWCITIGLSKSHPIAAKCGMGLGGILKSQQAEVVTVARQIVTEDLEVLSVYSVEGRVCVSLSQPLLLLFYCSGRRVQSCCNMQVFKVIDIR